jgi:hypothetical protein
MKNLNFSKQNTSYKDFKEGGGMSPSYSALPFLSMYCSNNNPRPSRTFYNVFELVKNAVAECGGGIWGG